MVEVNYSFFSLRVNVSLHRIRVLFYGRSWRRLLVYIVAAF